MKWLVERTKISTNVPFDLSDLKLHARVDAADEDSSLTNMGWEAVAELQGLASIALLRQSIRLTILNVTLCDGLSLPVGPMAPNGTTTVTIDGVASTDFDVVSARRPYLVWASTLHGTCVERVVIEYEAGFGDETTDVPEDIRYAILDQVAVDYDERAAPGNGSVSRSASLSRIAARYRGVSI